MTAVVGVYLHPKGCPVCSQWQQTGLSLIRYRGGTPAVDALSKVIDCPHCTNPDDLMQALPPDMTPTFGGAA